MPLLWDIVSIFLNSIVVLTPNGQFLDCATIVFSERLWCCLLLPKTVLCTLLADSVYEMQYCARYLLAPFTKCSTVHITCWLRLRNAVLCTLLADSVYEVQYCAHTCWLRLRCAVLCTLIAGSCYEVHYCAHYLLAPVTKCSAVHITCWLLLRSAVLDTHTHTHTHRVSLLLRRIAAGTWLTDFCYKEKNSAVQTSVVKDFDCNGSFSIPRLFLYALLHQLLRLHRISSTFCYVNLIRSVSVH